MNKKQRNKRVPLQLNPGYLFNMGANHEAWRYLGAHFEGGAWVFRVWAPRAAQVDLTGDFNQWGLQPMIQDEDTGIWEGIVSEDISGSYYKYHVVHHDGREVLKADPFALEQELRPGTASVVAKMDPYDWKDAAWMRRRRAQNPDKKPLNIYEVHLGSWMRHPDGRFYTYGELKERLIPYVVEMGYTHIELMPVMEHPNDESWGYQVTGYFSVTSRYGTKEEFKAFIDACHGAGLGVLLDWVPSHFVKDEHGLLYFDGTATYEPMDYHKAFNPGWGTMHFDFSKTEVQSFLLSNALFYLKEFHADGLRLDAVSSMIYLDYADKAFTPNEKGGNTDLQAIAFLQHLNEVVQDEVPGAIMIAEESTAYEKTTWPVSQGGLGFHYKWNMGWMNDLLAYMEMLPEHRVLSQRKLNFSFVYCFKEKYILPFSHDEVVHGKRSLLEKQPLDLYHQFAGVRLLLAYQFCHPGKKLNFMTNDIAQRMEWRYQSELEWVGLEHEKHAGVQHLVHTLSELYRSERSLYEQEMEPQGLEVLDAENPQCIVSFLRKGSRKKDFLVCLFNFQAEERKAVRVGVPYEGIYEEVLNTELLEFGGTWTKTQGLFVAKAGQTNGQSFYIEVILPQLAGLVIRPVHLKGDRRTKD
ncbi:1,4-alpha-glucan (glycogen) branching enzyme, GH-13-type [Clostridiaceae bacterium JG1575]|nr:1,4-alpha-glucan (glycogen) branching enzyme, GH-13-type [Clostridiaceae bacterium JG1575]